MRNPSDLPSDLVQGFTRRSIVGKRFGSLVVKDYLGHKGHTSYHTCVCDCGGTRIASRAMLATERTVRCTVCAERERRGEKSASWKGCGKLPMDLWRRYEREAAVRLLPFELTIEDGWALYEAQQGRCALTGVPIQMPPTNARKKEATVSLDRIDSSRGYVKGNVQWVHKAVNHLKSNVSDDLFVLVCHLVAKTRSTTLSEQFFHDNHLSMVKNVCKMRTGATHHRSKVYRIESEDGTVIEIKSLREFCANRSAERGVKCYPETLRPTLKTGRFYQGIRIISADQPTYQP